MERIYLDYAASAPLAPEAQKVVAEFASRPALGNPSSLHEEGRKVQSLLDKAHTTLAAILGVNPTEVVFTSGATESNTLAIRGVLAAWRKEHPNKSPHVVMTSIEHPSWRQVAVSEGAEVTQVPVSKEGVVSSQAVLRAIRPETALVGCMYVNNEIGTVQPISEIGKGIQTLRQASGTTAKWPVFHVDAVQAFPYLNTHSGHMRADSVTFSGHKYGALSGVGVLLVKKNIPIHSLLKGGGQEWGYRAGTENVLGALSLAAVCEWYDAHREEATQHAVESQSYLEDQLTHMLPQAAILGKSVIRAPHITYLWLPSVADESFVHKLDLAGVAVSSGSACSSGAQLPSTTLMAMGYTPSEAFGGIRISYGRFTTREEIDTFCACLQAMLS